MTETPTSARAAFEQALRFDTPENVVFGYLIAGIGSRFLATIVDTFLILFLQLAANLTLLFLVAIITGESLIEFGDSRSFSLLAAVFGLVASAFLWGYYIFFELLWNGQSPGKRLVGLRVIRQNGAPVDVAAAVIRNLVRIVDFLPLYYGIGVVSMFIDRQSRRLGDFAASTLVVYDRGAVTLEELARDASELERSMPAELEGHHSPAAAAGSLQAKHVALARSFLSRRQELHNQGELAVYLARQILADSEGPLQIVDEKEALTFLKQIAGRNERPAIKANVN